MPILGIFASQNYARGLSVDYLVVAGGGSGGAGIGGVGGGGGGGAGGFLTSTALSLSLNTTTQKS